MLITVFPIVGRMKTFAERVYQITLDDGSPDGTGDLVEAMCRNLGFAPAGLSGGRQFRPHLTLGRVKQGGPALSELSRLLEKQEITKAEMAARMKTSRAAVDRLLDASNTSVTLNTLGRAASALGRKVRIELVPA